MKRSMEIAAWLALAVPALYQLALLATAIHGRLTYPYDLEWMEGGMLHHALRIQDGHGIYAAPSVDFIPYLYTPLYPALIATLGKVFGISYTLGRMISVLSLVGIAVVAGVSIVGTRWRDPIAWCGTALALGLFCAIYPYVEGWYDVVRADTLFLFMVTAALAALPHLVKTGDGWRGHARVAVGAAILALAFFCKQTGIFYVALGGAIVVVVNWRRTVTYIVVSGAIGLGGNAALNASSGGWYWTYVSKIHRAHDFNPDRFWKSFGYILWHFPALTIVVAIALVGLGAIAAMNKPLPAGTRGFLVWAGAFAVSTVVGAIGWGTEFAHFNAYMPAFLHGALAAGAALPVLAGCAHAWLADQRLSRAIAALGAIALAYTCYHARWNPRAYMPTAGDVEAGDRLVQRLAAIDGDVWMPSHPWYVVLAGKPPHVHRMGIKDVTTRQTRTVIGLDEALAKHKFAAIVLDDRDLDLELPQIATSYRPALALPADERPHVYTGAHVVPTTIWVPRLAATAPTGAKITFDFEAPTWAGWTRSGPAWGDGPVTQAEPGQELVLGSTGLRFATSMHGGEVATGRMTSPSFTIDGARLTLALGGGTDATKLRVELWVDGALARTASVPEPGGESLRRVTWNVAELATKQATLVLVDDSSTGHLDLDDIWMWANP